MLTNKADNARHQTNDHTILTTARTSRTWQSFSTCYKANYHIKTDQNCSYPVFADITCLVYTMNDCGRKEFQRLEEDRSRSKRGRVDVTSGTSLASRAASQQLRHNILLALHYFHSQQTDRQTDRHPF